MKIWAIADLHLSFGVPNKEMDVFGPKWMSHSQKIEKHWREVISDEDLVLIAGDISWALHTEDAAVDLRWIASLPGTKVISKGNHDLWWKSMNKLKPVLPPRIHLIQNNAFDYQDVTIGGTRLWDHLDNDYSPYIEFIKIPSGIHVHPKTHSPEDEMHDAKIYKNELDRLRKSLDCLNPNARIRIAMLHYPPAGPINRSTEVTRILEEYKINFCVYGHLHNLKPDAPVNFVQNGISYICTACDFLDFKPYLLSS